MTTRRSFFAALVTPLIARWWPKRKSEVPFDFFISGEFARSVLYWSRHYDPMGASVIGTGLFDGIYYDSRLTPAQRNFDPRRLPE